MDGPQHYSEAERLLEQAEAMAEDKDFYREQDAVPALLAALAHATLANAAAAALGTSDRDHISWRRVAGANSGTDG
jgi:hypothetical protein